MAGSLIKIDEEIVSSAVASVSLTGIDNTYDVYLLVMNNVSPASDNKDLYMQYIKASDGSTDSTSNYDYATKGILASLSFQNNFNTNQTQFILQYARGSATNEQDNNLLYLFNTYSSAEYSFYTLEGSGLNFAGGLGSEQGGGAHSVAQSNSGVKFTWESGGNFASGTFTLYGLAK